MSPYIGGVTDLTLQLIALRLSAFVFIAAVHGFAVAAAAAALGDRGPLHDGRLSLNPLTHLDVVGTAAGVLFSVGWIRPVAIDPRALRPGPAGLALVTATGAAATLAAALALHIARPFVLPLLPDTASATFFALTETAGELSAWFALVNVLPLPPLTGSHLLSAALPEHAKILGRITPYAGVALAVAAGTGIVTRVLAPGWRVLVALMFGG